MQSKLCSILIIGMIIILAVVPASAYDYRGVPKPGDNNPENEEKISTEEVGTISDNSDLSSLLDSSQLTNLIMMIINIFLQLFSGSYS